MPISRLAEPLEGPGEHGIDASEAAVCQINYFGRGWPRQEAGRGWPRLAEAGRGGRPP